MLRRIILPVALIAAVVALGDAPGAAPLQKQDNNKKGNPKAAAKKAEKAAKADADGDLNALKLEVDALRALHGLDLTPPQLKELAKAAKDCADKSRKRDPAQVPAAVKSALQELRQALVGGNDETINDAVEKFDDQVGKLNPDFDDDYDITDAARRKAADIAGKLGLRQLIAFVGDRGDNLSDPAQALEDGVNEGKNLAGKEWDEHRDSVADDIAIVLAGTDGIKAGAVKSKVTKLLDRWHSKPPGAGDIEQEAAELTKGVTPTDMLRNALQHHIANLLSNPQMAAAIRAKLDGAKPGNGA